MDIKRKMAMKNKLLARLTKSESISPSCTTPNISCVETYTPDITIPIRIKGTQKDFLTNYLILKKKESPYKQVRMHISVLLTNTHRNPHSILCTGV